MCLDDAVKAMQSALRALASEGGKKPDIVHAKNILRNAIAKTRE